MNYSKYPLQIDSSLELPPSTDLITPVKSEIPNRLRDAIIKVESELGVEPSREYGSVRARLDAMQSKIDSLTISLAAISQLVADLIANGGSGTSVGGTPTILDKGLVPSNTSGNYAATGLSLSLTPLKPKYVTVRVNGLSNEIGNGVKTSDCYFSADGGVTARNLLDLIVSDQLYWNGLIVGFDLKTTDVIDFDYDV